MYIHVMKETSLFFNNNRYKLFGVLHQPDINSSESCKLGIVFCHPFAEEKLIAHRAMVNMARAITKSGLCCLRFDYMGHGDSDGNFEDATVTTRLSDILCAINFLKTKTGVQKVGILGVRFGSMLGALICAKNSEVNPLILISPIIDGKSYMQQCLRSNLSTQIAAYKKILKDRKQLIAELTDGHTVNIDGYLLTKNMYEEVNAIDLLKILPAQNVLILQITKSAKHSAEAKLLNLYQKYEAEGSVTELLNIKDDFFWMDTKIYNPERKGVQDAVVSFLRKILMQIQL